MTAAAALTAAHYRAQLAIKAHAVRTSQSLWSTWDGQQGAWARLLDLSTPMLTDLHHLSGQTARQYYAQLAAQHGKADRALPVPELPHEQMVRSLTITGLAGTFAAKSRGLSEQAARQIGMVKFAGSFSRLTLLGSRDVIVSTVAASHTTANAWQRVTSDAPCDFCESLAGARTTEDTFPAHDHCSCTAEPLFT